MLTDKIPSWLRGYLTDLGSTLGLEKDLDAQGNSINNLLRAQLEETTTPSTPPSGYKELFTKSAGLAHILDDAGMETPLLGQAGSSTWANRTYEGYEIVDTATTYTIGSGQDYADLAAAAADLRGLFLIENITLQMQENQTLSLASDQATFKGMIYAGGHFLLDLNTYTLTIDTDVGLEFSGQYRSRIENGTIQLGPNMLGYTFILLSGMNSTNLRADLTLDGQGNSCEEFIYLAGRDVICRNDCDTWNNIGSVTSVFKVYGATARFRNDPPSQTIENGGVAFLSNGNIVTEGGTETVP